MADLRLALCIGAMFALMAVPWHPAVVTTQTPEPAPELAQRYTVEATFDPDVARISGRLAVEWTNTTGERQEALPFRLYPNADYYGEGGIELASVEVDGVSVRPGIDTSDPTIMRVPLADAAQPGDRRAVAIGFTTTIPIDTAGSFGILRGNSADDTWSLVNWYPIVAGWEDGDGWYLEPPQSLGDPTFVTASSWSVTITHPDRYVLIGSGEERTSSGDGAATTAFELPVGREFAMVALPADRVEATTVAIDDLSLEIVLTLEHAVPGMAEAIESFARDAIPMYGEWFERPAQGELDVTVANLDGALGVSWSETIWLDLAQLTEDGQLDDVERTSLRFVVLHEIGHQWMASVIGTNSNNHTFLTEGLVNVLAVAVVREVDGREEAGFVFMGWVAGPYRAFVNGGQDAIADSPVGELSPTVHSLVTYGKGGVGFEAIRQEIGDEAFFAALGYLGTTHAWDIVTPAMFLDAFERASGQALDELWAFWFEEEGTTLAEVDAVIAAAGD